MRNLKSMEESCWGSGRVASSDFPLVAIWLQEQKMRLDRNRLESAHKDRLVALGALQDHGLNHAPGEGSKSLQTEWLQRLEELRQFKRVTGHCSVPMKFPSNPGLARWVHTQRMRRRMGKMSAGRARQLEKLGFVFEGRSQWEQRFLELVRFKDRVAEEEQEHEEEARDADDETTTIDAADSASDSPDSASDSSSAAAASKALAAAASVARAALDARRVNGGAVAAVLRHARPWNTRPRHVQHRPTAHAVPHRRATPGRVFCVHVTCAMPGRAVQQEGAWDEA